MTSRQGLAIAILDRIVNDPETMFDQDSSGDWSIQVGGSFWLTVDEAMLVDEMRCE